MSTQNETVLPFSDVLDSTDQSLSGAGLDWLDSLREQGHARYAEMGLPTVKLEDWKYTNLQPVAETPYRPVSEADGACSVDDVPSILPESTSGNRVVFVNGQARPDLSNLKDLPEGVRFEPLSHIMQSDPAWLESHLGKRADDAGRAMLALNVAAMNCGYVLHVGRGVVLDTPIEVVFIGGLADAPVAYFPRNLIIMEEASQAEIIVHHAGAGTGAYFSNSVSEISVAQSAVLRVRHIQQDAREATNISASYVDVARDGVYESFGLSIGGRLSRHETRMSLSGRGAACKIDGAYLLRGSEHCDNTLTVDHLVPDTTSDEMFKGVLDDQSRAVFQGKVIVHRDAQRSDGKMLNKTMLMSDTAEIDSKPELEIYADDVKCAHGATSGQVDKTALFYLRSRGIPEAQARNLLIRSFLGEVTERIANETVREAIIDKIVQWLPAACYRQEEWREE